MSRADFGRAARAVWAAIVMAAWFGIAAPSSQAQEGGGPSAEPTPEQIALGNQIFLGKAASGTCWACHGKNAKGTANAPDLTDAKWINADGSLEGIEDIIAKGVPKPKKYKAPMAPMGGGKLSPDQIKAVAAYVYSLSHGGGKSKN